MNSHIPGEGSRNWKIWKVWHCLLKLRIYILYNQTILLLVTFPPGTCAHAQRPFAKLFAAALFVGITNWSLGSSQPFCSSSFWVHYHVFSYYWWSYTGQWNWVWSITQGIKRHVSPLGWLLVQRGNQPCSLFQPSGHGSMYFSGGSLAWVLEWLWAESLPFYNNSKS